MRIGVLALQGAFIEHRHMLEALGVESFEIRQKSHIPTAFDGLILPGGESTTMGKLLRELELFDPIQTLIKGGLPVFGTCAGLLLLAKEIANDDKRHLATMDIRAKRNAYGRQLGSFHTRAEFKGLGEIPMTFIRAPYVETLWDGTEPLAEVDGKIVAARQGRQLVTAFHPELDDDLSVHGYFLGMVTGSE
ncbi:MAG: pyridoxal 5'-phosphate synthase glutaminase subunit PdxT [Oscillospiraceae bacterium]|nr:pyridoxal 5'-phosphate synthase glutaminase subunit PdxT [Oscillospiraceae bacterium]